ncbi:MAG: hypothetical protein JWM27_3878 [Gemmatimonadetes bacterium]|nr:hypothetical protein [Gemmatimonadota bacterium]
MTSRARFWAQAAAGAVVTAALAGLLPLAPGLHLATAADRRRIWLLTVWTAGVLAILFGLAGWIAGLRGLGFREVANAGSVEAAAEERRRAGRGGSLSLMAAGALLLGIYFAGWLLLARA